MDNSNVIKIEKNGYIVYVNSVTEARAFIGDIQTYQVPSKVLELPRKKTIDVDFDQLRKNLNKSKLNKVKKTTTKSYNVRWTPEEIKYIFNNISLGNQAIGEDKYLRTNHPRTGIQQMFWKVSKNPRSYVVRKELQDVIDALHNK